MYEVVRRRNVSPWRPLFLSDLAGSGGLLSTVQIGPAEFRVDGTGASFTQTAAGIGVARLATSKTVLGASIAALDPDYDPSAVYAVVCRAAIASFAVNTQHLTSGMWRDSAGPKEMLHGGPYYATTGSAGLTVTARRESTSGAFSTEVLGSARAAVPAYARWATILMPGAGLHVRYSWDAGLLPLPAPRDVQAFATRMTGGVGPLENFAFDRFGVQVFLPAGAFDVTLERLGLFKLVGGR